MCIRDRKHPIALYARATSPPLSDACRERYRVALVAGVVDQSRLINELICNGSMCPYIAGAAGTGLPVNQTALVNRYFLFAAVDTASLSDDVSIEVDAVTVDFVAGQLLQLLLL